MQYQKMEVNLLPPELQPAPTIRLFFILNIALIMGTVIYLAVASGSSMYRAALLKSENVELTDQIKSKETIRQSHADLIEVKNSVDRFGRIVSLASIGYVEMPLLLERVSGILPEGVYLRSISNDSPAEGATNTVISINLSTAQRDPDVVEAALRAFKSDPLFKDSYMSNVEFKSEALQPQLAAYGVNWTVSGPDIATPIVDMYQFEILSNVQRPIDTRGFPVVKDYSAYLTDVKFLVPPPKEDPKAKIKKGKGGKPKADAPKEAAGAPEGVEVKEVN